MPKIPKKILNDYVQCENSFAYFLFEFCITQDNKAQLEHKFPRWKYIENFAYELQYCKSNIIINKCRQAGCSWILAAYALWRVLFFDNWNIPMISKVGESAFDSTTQSFGGKVVWLHSKLPIHLKQTLRITMVPKKIINERNGSGLHMYNSAEDSGRGGSGAEFIGDEAAFFLNAEMVLASIAPSVGRMILNSTFNGDNVEQPYYKTWIDKSNGWKRVEIDYYDNPEHTQETYEEECRKMNYDKRRIAQELDRNPSLSMAGKMFEFESVKHVYNLPEELLRNEILNNCVYSGHDIGYGDGHAYVLTILRNINGVNHLYVYKDYYKTEQTPKEITKQFKADVAIYPHRYQQDIADPTAISKGQDGGASMFNKFALEGLNFIKGSNDHNMAIIVINTMLKEGTLHLHGNCKWLAEALAQAHHPTDRTGRVTDYTTWTHDKYSHVLCAFSYVVLAVYGRIGRKLPAKNTIERNSYGEIVNVKEEEKLGLL